MSAEKKRQKKRQGRMKPKSEEVWKRYLATQSIYKVARAYGVHAQTICNWLKAGGHSVKDAEWATDWSEAEISLLKDWYETHSLNVGFDLDSLAEKLGRHKTNISRKARQLGLTNARRKSVLMHKQRRKTANDEELRALQSRNSKERIAVNGHPRGFLGKKRPEEFKRRQSELVKEIWRNGGGNYMTPENIQKRSDRMSKLNVSNREKGIHPYSRAKRGQRDDLGTIFFRSRWEANYARYLNWMIARGDFKSWEYECKTFWFEEIRRGVRSYCPDFKVTLPDGSHEWHEVKGWMDAKSKTKLARMQKYYPDEKLVLIDKSWFKSARKTLASIIPNWETG